MIFQTWSTTEHHPTCTALMISTYDYEKENHSELFEINMGQEGNDGP